MITAAVLIHLSIGMDVTVLVDCFLINSSIVTGVWLRDRTRLKTLGSFMC